MLNAIKRTFFFTPSLFSFFSFSVYTGFLTTLVICMLRIIHKSGKIPVTVVFEFCQAALKSPTLAAYYNTFETFQLKILKSKFLRKHAVVFIF